MSVIDTLISYDPSNIVVTRHTKVPRAGGYTYTTTDLDPQVVRIYTLSSKDQNEMQIPEGEVKRRDVGILAGPDADFVCGHDSYDTFEYQGRTYRVDGVNHYTDSNIDEHIQVDCYAV